MCFSVEGFLSTKLKCAHSRVSFYPVVVRSSLVHRNETFSETLHKNGPQIERFKDGLGKRGLEIK